MLTALDHIIVGVNNLELAARTFSEKLGLAVSGGGNHPEGGTANRIIVLGDTYIELIAVRNPAEAQERLMLVEWRWYCTSLHQRCRPVFRWDLETQRYKTGSLFKMKLDCDKHHS